MALLVKRLLDFCVVYYAIDLVVRKFTGQIIDAQNRLENPRKKLPRFDV